jgi:hypothetical protein
VAGQLAVSWTPDAAAWKYYVFQSASGGAFTFAASVLDPSAAPPAPTTYTATGLTGGVSYCYAVEAAYTDGTMSDLGVAGCRVATGGGSTGGSSLGPTMSGSDFQLTQGQGFVVDGDWHFTSVPATLIAGLPILGRNSPTPIHPVIREALFMWNRASGSITGRVRARNVLTHDPAFDVVAIHDTTGIGWFVPGATANGTSTGEGPGLLPYTKSPEVAVWVEITITDTSSVVGGALVSWDDV